ncbi:uncharacterized protein LOC144022753 isoform X2 [Festucalex cinctus]
MAGKLSPPMLWLLCIVTRGQNVTLVCLPPIDYVDYDYLDLEKTRILWRIKGTTQDEEYLIMGFVSEETVVKVKSNIDFADRLTVTQERLVIKDVRVSDAGNYTCNVRGLFAETTELVVYDTTEEVDDVEMTSWMDIMPPARIIALVIFLLIIVVMATATCLSVLKIRRKTFEVKYSVDSSEKRQHSSQYFVMRELKKKKSFFHIQTPPTMSTLVDSW